MATIRARSPVPARLRKAFQSLEPSPFALARRGEPTVIDGVIRAESCPPPSAQTSAEAFRHPSWRARLAAAVVIAAAAFLAYHNTFSLPFVFDDQVVVIDNTTIRQLWPLGDVLSAPRDGSGAAGRPLLNLTFALNYAWGGLEVPSYHVVNLLLHTASALLLFALVWRTLLLPGLRARFEASALPLALTIAGLWAVHPLNTESVTCVSQRTELLVGFFFLLTLFAIVRSADTATPSRWHAVAVVSCVLGMASKEVMATMPLIALLFDRTFMAGTFRQAWQRRRGLHLGLMSSWLLLGWLVFSMGGSRGEAAGFGLGMSSWSYALKQCAAIIHYLRLSFWPEPLILDYGTDVVHLARDVLPQGLLLLGLLAATVWALIRRPMIGFMAAWFFIILGPSSSFVPLVAQTMAEHRMYLPLITVIALAVLGLHHALGRRSIWAWAAPAACFVVVAVQRNDTYRTELGLWQDTAMKRPTNPRAHLCYGLALMKQGQPDEAVTALLEVLLLDPTHSTAHNSLGQLFAARGWMEDAVGHYEIALQGKDNHAAIHSNLCDALRVLGRLPEALEHGQAAVRLNPRLAAAHGNLALVLANSGDEAGAMPHYAEAVRLDPDLGTVRNNYGVALMNAGRLSEAKEQLDAAVRLAPDLAAAHNSRGAVLDRLGQKEPAAVAFETALRLNPEFEGARQNLAALKLPSESANTPR
jgi:tetratricopeptide (TPR) repeat protein